jgi:hypothetical protein
MVWATHSLGETVPIVVSEAEDDTTQLAARELAAYLARLYPESGFPVANEPTPSGPVIRVGSIQSGGPIREYVDARRLAARESFVVTTAEHNGRTVGIIAGADARGTMSGVYALLEKLGCGFYLSYDAVPALERPFSFDGWKLADAPLVAERFVFNWHNFLSGCSTWNAADWEHWICQAQKMGYNGVMVHAYGNNPMVSFSFQGRTKPVGFLSTTIKGRDWSTQHVNDVRRLWGGSVFEEPAFGCEAALVPDDQRAEAARALMNRVFACAEERAMRVYFAVDVDTASANPQSLIESLPASARFEVTVQAMRWMNQAGGKMWLADTDTPAGYEYYKAQVESLLEAYPQIDCLVVWFRHNATPWMAMKQAEMPDAWQREYRSELERTPDAAKLWRAHNFFALAKIVAAFERALEESGRDDVELAIGSWRFTFFPPAHRFLPRHIKFIPLDWEVLKDLSQMDTAERRRAIAEVGAHRPVVPVVWAHHDDGNYVGRPYKPYEAFYDRLVDAKAAGFGIIHWTTRPLDLYFASLSEQVWRTTKNRPLGDTCQEMAARSFGQSNRQTMGEYLERWVSEAPKIGRETGDFFIDRKLEDIDSVLAGLRHRTPLLERAAREASDPEALARVRYFQGLERYLVAVHRTEAAFSEAKDHLKSGDIEAARRAMEACRPGEVIERYAQFSKLDGMTRGEQGLVVSMNLRWLVHYVRFRQVLGTEPIRYNFAPTSHDPLAQSMGTFTFHFEPDRSVWQCLGTEETGASTFVIPDDIPIARSEDIAQSQVEICRTGIETEEPVTIPLGPILSKGGRGQSADATLPPGSYRLHLLLVDPTSLEPGEQVFDIQLFRESTGVDSPPEPLASQRVDVIKLAGGPNRPIPLALPFELPAPSALRLALGPFKGKALLSGVIIEPLGP